MNEDRLNTNWISFCFSNVNTSAFSYRTMSETTEFSTNVEFILFILERLSEKHWVAAKNSREKKRKKHEFIAKINNPVYFL